MPFQLMMFVLSLTERFADHVVLVIVAVWFLSVGYLLWKRVSRQPRALKTGESSRATLAILHG